MDFIIERKIFVSYKYCDEDGEQMPYNYNDIVPVKTTARRYVEKLEEVIGVNDIFKGEHDGEDLSKFTDDTILSHLKDKIFDSSITIVLVSKNILRVYSEENINYGEIKRVNWDKLPKEKYPWEKLYPYVKKNLDNMQEIKAKIARENIEKIS